MVRMRTESHLSCLNPLTEKEPGKLAIGHINIRSLGKHAVDLQNDNAIQKLDILCVSETPCHLYMTEY